MPDQIEVENIVLGQKTLAQLFKLPQQMIDYLWERIDIVKKNPICRKKKLAGNISRSYELEDPQDLVVQHLEKIIFNQVDNPKMFEFIKREIKTIYRRVNNKEFRVEPYLSGLWVNFQKKGEFQPVHSHNGTFSFVIWMDIPYNYKDECNLPNAKTSNKNNHGGNFSFLTASGTTREVKPTNIEMSPEMNGYCCVFPSDLCHQVYPFYTSDKDRISISGNISYRSTKPNPPPIYQFPFHMSGT